MTEDINPATGRIHGRINKTGTDSGRFSHSNPNCFPPNVEILTKNGWIRFDELPKDIEVASFNQDTGLIYYELPTNYLCKQFNGKLVHRYGDRQLDIVSTPDHQFLIRNRKSYKFNRVNADSVGKDCILLNAGWLENSGVNLRESSVILLCAVQADAYESDTVFDFVFNKERKVVRLESALLDLKIPYYKRPKNSGWRISIKKSDVPSFVKKVFTYDLLSYGHSTLQLIAKEIFLWDGDSRNRNRYTSKHKINCDVAQAILTLTGRRTNIVSRTVDGKVYWDIKVSRSYYSLSANNKVEMIDYTGNVYCVTVPSGNIVVRYAGKTIITGNCAQIPVRSEEGSQFRALFKPEKGNKFVRADYAGLELLILAEYSDEEKLIHAINRGDDIHCFTMSNMLGCPYDILVRLKEGEEMDSQEFTQARSRFESRFQLAELLKIENPVAWVKKFRDYVKTLTYGLSYGLSEFGLMNKFHCSLQDAKLFIKEFFDSYPSLGRYLKIQGELGLQRYYAINSFGRRRYFTVPKMKTYPQVEAEEIKALDKQKRVWDSIEEEEWEEIMRKALERAKKEYNGKINSIKRRSANFIPQSTNADMIKLAIYLFGKYYKGDGGLILCIHDELIAEVPEKDVEQAKDCMKKAMEKAGQRFIVRCKIEVDVKVLDKWEK